MAAVGAEVTGSYILSSGVVNFFILLLLLSIFLTALCSDCGRRSFELREPEDKNPSALIRVVKLEEAMVARENPMISEIQNDEKEFKSAEIKTTSTAYLWNSHREAPQQQQHEDVQTNGSPAIMKPESDSENAADSNPEEEITVSFTPWRCHLRAPQSNDLHSSNGGDHQELAEELTSAFTDDLSDRDVNSTYAQISKRVRLTVPSEQAPEQVQPEEREESQTPPLPDRRMQLDG